MSKRNKKLYRGKNFPFGLEPDDCVRRLSGLLNRGTVLDIGCGYGRNAHFLAGGGQFNVTALDIDQERIDVLNRWADDSLIPNIITQCIDVKHFPPTREYDVCVIAYMLHCLSLPEAIAVLTNTRRYIRPGGYVCIAAFMNEGYIFDESNQSNYFPGNKSLEGFYDGWIVEYKEGLVQCFPVEPGVVQENMAAFVLAQRPI